jgi:hypothetical protein
MAGSDRDLEAQLREKLRKIEALYAGARTEGERMAAAAAAERIRAKLRETRRAEPEIEMRFSLEDGWRRQLFVALCRRYGMRPYRYPRQRRNTLMLRAPASFLNQTLWPEYVALSSALAEYLAAATDKIIREEVFGEA